MTVVTLGETMVALRGRGPLRLGGPMDTSVAGAESTVAVGLARLGHAVRWISRVGDDESGELVLRTLRAEGVDLTAVNRGPGPTGLILLEQRLPDLTRVQYHRTGSAATGLSPADVALRRGDHHVHLTGITPALGAGPRAAVAAAFDSADAAGLPVSFDVNLRTRLWASDDAAAALTPLARRATIVIGSPDEIDLVGGTAALLQAGVTEVVIKLGARGAAVHTTDESHDAPGHLISVVDSIGAGDAFTAGYLSGRLDGLDLLGRLRRGNSCGAFVVAGHGDWEGLPTRDELNLLALEEGVALR